MSYVRYPMVPCRASQTPEAVLTDPVRVSREDEGGRMKAGG